jgi:hypothetical protein
MMALVVAPVGEPIVRLAIGVADALVSQKRCRQITSASVTW